MMGFKALLVGINKYPESPLRGCVNDVRAMKELLSKYGATADNVHVLLDGEGTREKILREVRWLVKGTAAGDVRLFHFSGHGTYVPDESGDEKNFRDECLVPVDNFASGLLIDDELRKEYEKVHAEARLVLIMDSCHSGTVSKGPRGERMRFLKPPAGVRKTIEKKRETFVANIAAKAEKALEGKDVSEAKKQATIAAMVKAAWAQMGERRYGVFTEDENIILIAGCTDQQTSADAKFGKKYHGALTHFLLKHLAGPAPQYETLVRKVGDDLENEQFSQTPQLLASKTNRKRVFLSKP